ncbi:Protein TSD2 [Hypsizygus marmoreus]|uniref:Protein TSD2 n=1 Tax=Hypsizygus marmoreus TaxID=39966 RepID=A0A369JPX2_HYPMA|nr:Protein TSD2 [Hypsizygus marmoreus]
MVWIPPPQLGSGTRPSYGETYAKILAKYRSSPLTAASSVIILVLTDVDALCAARMLSDLLGQDDVIHRIIPLSGYFDLENLKDDLAPYTELHTLIMINLGALQDINTYFGDFTSKLDIHIIDSSRPLNLYNIFLGGDMGDRIIFWDDGSAEKIVDVGKSFEATTFEPQVESDDEDSDFYSDEDEPERSDEEEDYEDGGMASGKRRSLGDGDGKPSKRRRVERERAPRMSRDEYDEHQARLHKYYQTGSYHGQSASGTIYILATVLERVDNDLLWFAILGLTYQYITSRISRDSYDTYHSIYYDEVSRLNPPPPNGGNGSLISLNPDDTSVRATDELRFMLFRHWTLYDAMFHSSYVASKLGIWKERGRKRLTGLLAKMGFSILQTQQPYPHMDLDLKKDLLQKLNDIAPEYGLVELSYPSFMRCYGYRSQPLSAADAVEGIGALLDVAGGVRMEVEVEGSRNGGEWFGGGRVWEAGAGREGTRRRGDEGGGRDKRPENAGGGSGGGNAGAAANKVKEGEEEQDGAVVKKQEVEWWVKNFWTAFDALDDIAPLRDALSLSMSLHRAIIRQGTSIIDKQDIRTLRTHRVVVLRQGPDLALFAHPGVLARLALWLVDALRDRVPVGVGVGVGGSARSKRGSLPFVVACLNEGRDTYMIVGVMAALEFGDVTKNHFGSAFQAATAKCNTELKHQSFDASVLEIPMKDLETFLAALCDEPE